MKTKTRKVKSFLLAVVLTLSQFALQALILPVSAEQNTTDSENIEERSFDENIYIDPSSISIYRGQAYQLTACPQVSGDVSWSSNNTSIATVTQYGLVVGVSAGTTYICATVDSTAPGINVAQCQVTVSSAGVVTSGT
ncbi:MAG: Ig-like domain-containing protein [Clostridia bacterium]|nr:Ig-like domain-containing protein [Clostridia bacterium]MBR5767214.1 Ig-like domain-containing protein [Clostridia bacterium]